MPLSLTLLALATVAGCSTMTHAERKEKAEQHWGRVRATVKLQMARQQYERGHTAEALKFLDEALTWDRANPDAFLLLAQCRLEEGKLTAAQRAIEQAAAHSPQPAAKIVAMQGVIAERRGNYEQAAAHYRQARELDDTVVDYIVSEAECLAALGRTQPARELLAENLLEYDNDPSLHALIGEIALRDGDAETARISFRAVLAAGVYDPVIVEEFALLSVRRGHHHDALSVIEPLVRERGEANVPVSVLRAAAESMLALQRTEPARKLLGAVVENNSNDVHAWLLLARCGIAMGDAHITRRAADNVRRLAPGDPQGTLLDAYARVQEGKLKAAEHVLRQALRHDHRDALVYCMLGLVAERGQDPAAARAHYRAALRVDPTCTWAQAALQRVEVVVPANSRPACESGDSGPEAVASRARTSKEGQ